MLQAIREKAQGWIAWAIVILITIPFALWGIQEYLGVGSEPEVAVVDGETITQRMLDERVRDFRESIRAQLGDSYSPDLFSDSRVKEQVRDAMIEEMLLAANADAWNIRTSDMQARGFIASIPAFQRDGRFDQQAYDAAVRNRGMSRAGFEQRVRQEMALGQLRSGVRDTAFVTDTDFATRVRLRDEKRTIGYARIPVASFLDEVNVTPDALRAYYDANLDRYRTPEKVKLSYVVLDAALLGGFVEVSEEGLRQYFSDHKSEFVAREEREMRHILIAVAAGADEETVAKAQAKTDQLLQQISDGADFAMVAKENSDDPGSAASGGDLGWVERGLMVPAFEEAAFSLNSGEISQPVRTDFGFHIIQVTGVRGGSDAGFDELRDKVEQSYRKFEAENLYFDYAERLAESAYENSDSLTPAAEALGLQVRTTDWVTRSGPLPDVLNSPKVMAAAFSDDVLTEGHNSELIEVAPQKTVVVRVAEHEPAGVKGFDENLAAIEQDFKREKASELAAQAGGKRLGELRDGSGSIRQLAADHGWTLEEPGAVRRDDATVPAEVLVEAFGLAPPAGRPAYAGVVAAEGDYVLIEVSAVEGGSTEALSDAERPLLIEQAAGQLAGQEMEYFVESLRNRADIELKSIAE